MATHEEVNAALLEARLALLTEIKTHAEGGRKDAAATFAQAYASITNATVSAGDDPEPRSAYESDDDFDSGPTFL